MELNHTASGKYQFNTVYFNKNILECVDLLNIDIATKNNFKKMHLYPCKYGFDLYVYILSKVLTHIKKNTDDIFKFNKGTLDLNIYLEIVHKGWRKNYLYWSNKKPYKKTDLYQKPSKSIINDANNRKAILFYNKLSKSTITIYTDIIESIFKLLLHEFIKEKIKNLNIAED